MKSRLTKDEFEIWRANPVTEVVNRYLLDFAALIRSQWAMGENWTPEAKFQEQNLKDLATLDLNSIESFYAREESDEQTRESG